MTRYDADMQHSIVSRHVAWPARYLHPRLRACERRLGLHAGPAFATTPGHRTVLHRPEASPLTALRAPWRAVVMTPRRTGAGRRRSGAVMAWTSSERDGGSRRSSLAPAWRG